MKLLPKSSSMRLWLSRLYMKYFHKCLQVKCLLLCHYLKIQIIHYSKCTKDFGYYIEQLTFLPSDSALSMPFTCFWKWDFRNSFIMYCEKLPSHFTRKMQKFCWFKHWLNVHNIRFAYKEEIKESVNTSLLGLWYVWKQNPIKPLYLLIFVLIKLLWVLLAVYTMKIWRSSMIIFIFVLRYFTIHAWENLLESI